MSFRRCFGSVWKYGSLAGGEQDRCKRRLFCYESQVTVVKLPPAKLWEPANSISDVFRIVCAADKNHFTPSSANISAKLDARTIYLAKF